MSFAEVQFPTDIAYDASGGPGYRTSIVSTDSGQEYRTSRWSRPRRRYDVGYGLKSIQDVYTVVEFYVAVLGPATGFRFKDWSDYSTGPSSRTSYWASSGVTPTDEVLGSGDGSKTTFQLLKTYTTGAFTQTRLLTKPVSGTVKVSIDDTEQTSGWTVDTTTGIVTFNTAPTSGGVVKAGCEFDVPVRFGAELDEQIEALIPGFEAGRIPNIPLIEILDTTPSRGFENFGGSSEFTLSAERALTMGDSRLVVVDTSGSPSLVLPDPAILDDGGPYWIIQNLAGGVSLPVKDESSTTIASIPAGDFGAVWLADDTWVLLGL